LADRDIIGIQELQAEDWISWSTGQNCHDWMVQTLRAAGVQPRLTHTASERSTQLALVEAGLGIAIIPRLGRESVARRVRFVPLEPRPTRRVFVLWRESAAPRPAIGAALDALDVST